MMLNQIRTDDLIAELTRRLERECAYALYQEELDALEFAISVEATIKLNQGKAA